MNRFFQKISFLMFLAVAMISVRLAGQTTLNLTDPIPLDPNVRTGVLPNGMHYYIRKNVEPANRAELRLAVNAGSMMEDDDQQGLAHFTEHMAFNGTAHFKKNELVNYLESIGTKFGAHLNAYTSFDETVYMLQVPTDDDEIMRKALLVLEDWSQALSFENEEIDKERGVVIEEWRLGRGADERMMQRYFPVIFQDSRYADRLPIGKKEILEKCSYETIKRFYQKWYKPDLMAIMVVGDVDPDKMEATIKTQFGAIPKPATPTVRPFYDIPDHAEPGIAVEQDKEATMTVMQMMYVHPAKEFKTLGDMRSMLVEDLAGEIITGRLDELKSAGKAPFLFAGCGSGSFLRPKWVFSGFALMEPSKVTNGLEIMLTEMERARRFGFLATELDRAKKKMLSQYESAYNEKDNTESGDMAREYVANFLSGDPAPGAEKEYEIAKSFMPTITLDEVNAAIGKMITKENMKVVLTGPEKEGIRFPTREEILSLVQGIRETALEPWKDITDDRPLVGKEPAPGKVASENKNATTGVTEWTLSNGARVIVKPTNFKSDEILFSAWSPGGSSRASDKDFMSADNCGSVITKAGAGPFSRATLDKKLSDKVMYLDPWVDQIWEGMEGQTRPEDLETFLQMVYLYHTAPRKDSESFTAFLTEMKTYLGFSSGPEGAWRDTVNVAMHSNHPRFQPLTEESINSINQQNAYMFYLDRFGDASDFTYLIVGNVNTETLKPLVEKWIGGLPGNARKETWKDIGVKAPDGVVKKSVYKGSEPKSMVNVTFHGPMLYNQANALRMNAMVKVLSIMLRESMREDKGGVYGVRVNPEMKKLPKEGYQLTISFGCSPDNVDDLIATAMKDIRNLQDNGPSEINLGKAKETFRREHETDLEDNNWWKTYLTKAYQNGEATEQITEYDTWVQKLTAKDVQDAAKQYFNMEKYVQVVLYPAK